MKNSRPFLEFVFIGCAMLAVNACSVLSAAPVPTVTSAPTATSVPTIKPTRTVTPIPSITPTPTITPMLDQQDFFGTWTVWDNDARGPNFLTFNEDGTFTATHGPQQGQLLHAGTYKLAGNELTFLSWWSCEPDQRVGTYLIRLNSEEDSIRFFPVDDPCEDRAYAFTNRIIKWDRFVPTATPSP